MNHRSVALKGLAGLAPVGLLLFSLPVYGSPGMAYPHEHLPATPPCNSYQDCQTQIAALSVELEQETSRAVAARSKLVVFLSIVYFLWPRPGVPNGGIR